MLKKKDKLEQNNANSGRILYYDFFAGLFLYDLLLGREFLLKEQLNVLKMHPINDDDMPHLEALYTEIAESGVKNLLHQYTYSFMLPFNPNPDITELSKKKRDRKKPILTSGALYLSYYLDGSIAGVGLQLAKSKVRKSKVRLNEENFRENEEHFGFLMLFIKHLLQNNEIELANEVFKECIKPMYPQLVGHLKGFGDENLYCNVGYVLESFLDFEAGLVSN